MPKNTLTIHPVYFNRYIDLVPEINLTDAFKNQGLELASFLKSISEEKSKYAYASGKWSIKELLQHLIDSERIFGFRALCFARGEKQNIPGFEEDDYASLSHANERSWLSLVEEFLAVRKTTEILFQNFNTEDLNRVGRANDNQATAESIGFTTIGHYIHHKKILIERYLD